MLLIFVGLGAAGVAIAAAVLAVRLDINTGAFNSVAKRLVLDDHLDRLAKVCKVTDAPYVRACGALLAEAPTIAASAASKEDLCARLRDGFAERFAELAESRLSLLRGLSWVGMLSSIAAAAPSMVFMLRPTLPLIAGVLGAAIGAFAVTRHARIVRSPARFDELAVALAQHYDSKRRVDEGAFRSAPADAPAPPAATTAPPAATMPTPPSAPLAVAREDDDGGDHGERGERAPAMTLRCASCGADGLMDVSDEAIERLRVTQPGADATLLRARVCKQCGRIDWYVDPKKVGELA